MSVSARFHLELTATETPALNLDLAPDPDIGHKISGSEGTLIAGTTVPATKVWSDSRALSGGTDTFDLTALVNASIDNVDMTGLKVQLVKIKAVDANTAVVVFAVGATNGYDFFGDSNGQVAMDAGCEQLFFWNDKLADVSATVKNVDITSSDADAVYEIIIVAG